MKQQWIHQKHHPRLTLFFAGWGMDATPFENLQPVDSDLLLCYDYRRLDFDPTGLKDYEELRVVAWSMGVWAATVVLSKLYPATPFRASLSSASLSSASLSSVSSSNVDFSDASFSLPHWVDSVAINGTPLPVDDRFGIPEAIFRGTLQGLDARNLEKFYRRMCVTREYLAAFLACRPQRTIEDLKEELHAIGTAASFPSLTDVSAFRWRRSIIGTRDLIFPPAHQLAAWEALRQSHACPLPEVVDEPHFTARIIDELIHFRTEPIMPPAL